MISSLSLNVSLGRLCTKWRQKGFQTTLGGKIEKKLQFNDTSARTLASLSLSEASLLHVTIVTENSVKVLTKTLNIYK